MMKELMKRALREGICRITYIWHSHHAALLKPIYDSINAIHNDPK